MCRSISKHSNPNRKREIRDNFTQKAKHSDKHIEQKRTYNGKRIIKWEIQHRKQTAQQHHTRAPAQRYRKAEPKAKPILTNGISTNATNWKRRKPRPVGLCPTRGGYKTENGQEVFLSDNEIRSAKFRLQKHLALTGFQLQSRI